MTAMAETSRGDWWLAKLGEGTREEFDDVPEIEGRVPAGLSGTLYRNGPGLYERAGFKKWNLLDGDGMIRATSFAGGSVRFRTRFVRTKKFEAEDKAGRFLYPTWTTPAPRRWENIPGYPRLGQAGVTTVAKGGRLYAFDEVGPPYGLDPASLETTGLVKPDSDAQARGRSDYKAHTRTDGENGDWVLIGREVGETDLRPGEDVDYSLAHRRHSPTFDDPLATGAKDISCRGHSLITAPNQLFMSAPECQEPLDQKRPTDTSKR
jgi:carotenoid cleavage dioxygenase-like enzyme